VYAAAVLLSGTDLSVLDSACAKRQCTLSYVSGMLGFREEPVSVQAIRGLPMAPYLVLCDGHGVAHPRGCGLACCIGLWLDIPTIGVEKRRLFGEFEEPGEKRGDRSPLVSPTHSEGREKRIGTVLRSRIGCKALFVSPGHRISHEQAVEWVLRTATCARMPEPLRLAHQEAKRMMKESSRGSTPESRTQAQRDACQNTDVIRSP